jgi:hypothetical protein
MSAPAHEYPLSLVYFDVTIAPPSRKPQFRLNTVCDPEDADAVHRSTTDLAERLGPLLPGPRLPRQSLMKVGIWICQEPVELLSVTYDAHAALYGTRAARDGEPLYVVLHREQAPAAHDQAGHDLVRVPSCPHWLSIREIFRQPDRSILGRYGLPPPPADLGSADQPH